MARNFDGANDSVTFGSDAAIDNFAVLTIALWLRRDVPNSYNNLARKNNSAESEGWNLVAADNVDGNVIRFYYVHTTEAGIWESPAVNDSDFHHFVVTYDRGSTTNDPVMYLDGASVTVTENTPPSGTPVNEAADVLGIGEAVAGFDDHDGLIGWFNYVNAIWDAAQVNRAKWWGRPGGAQAVYHPLMTTKLANEGTATAAGTATGTTVLSLPRVERCWGSLMGCGR